jgi:serine/threonine protein kinase
MKGRRASPRVEASAELGAETRDLLQRVIDIDANGLARAELPIEFDGLRIVRELGRGGMGEVYLAEERALGRYVAVKVLRRAPTDDWVAEARVISGLHHPAVVALHRIGTVGSVPYLVYELVPGIPLSRAPLPMPLRRALAVARNLATAVAVLHRASVVHGDVKPSNVMIAPDPVRRGNDVVTLIDFGLARRLGMEPFRGAGTPTYMAPELRDGALPSPATDAYALGLVVLELLTGQRDVRALRTPYALPADTADAAQLISAVEGLVAPVPAERWAVEAALEVLDATQERRRVVSATPTPKREVVSPLGTRHANLGAGILADSGHATMIRTLRVAPTIALTVGYGTPPDDEWGRHVAVLVDLQRDPSVTSGVCLSFLDGPGPNAAQRRLVARAAALKGHEAAVVTGSLVVRGLATAMAWLGVRLDAFGPGEWRRAFARSGITRPNEILRIARIAMQIERTLAKDVGALDGVRAFVREPSGVATAPLEETRRDHSTT